MSDNATTESVVSAAELSKKLDNFAKLVHDVQAENEKSVNKSEKVERMVEKATEQLDGINKAHAAIEAQQVKIDSLEKSLDNAFAAKHRFAGKSAKSEDFYDSKEYVALQDSVDALLTKGHAISDDHVKQMQEVMTKHYCIGKAQTVRDEVQREVAKSITKSMNVATLTAGGFWVLPDRLGGMIDKQNESSPIRQLATIETVTSDRGIVMVDDEVLENGGWVGELELRSDTATNAIGEKVIDVHELYAMPQVTQKLLDDGANVANYIFRKGQESLTLTENLAFTQGAGPKRPQGYATLPAAADPDVYERGTIGQLESTVSLGFDADDIISMDNLMKEAYQPNAAWMMKRKTFGVVMKLKQTDGTYLMNPEILTKGAPRMLLQKPIHFDDGLGNPGVAGSLAIALADWRRAYTIIDRIGIRVIRDDITTPGRVKFYMTKRVGGAVTSFDAIKLLRIKA